MNRTVAVVGSVLALVLGSTSAFAAGPRPTAAKPAAPIVSSKTDLYRTHWRPDGNAWRFSAFDTGAATAEVKAAPGERIVVKVPMPAGAREVHVSSVALAFAAAGQGRLVVYRNANGQLGRELASRDITIAPSDLSTPGQDAKFVAFDLPVAVKGPCFVGFVATSGSPAIAAVPDTGHRFGRLFVRAQNDKKARHDWLVPALVVHADAVKM